MAPPHHSSSHHHRGGPPVPSSSYQGAPPPHRGADPRSDRRSGPGGRDEGRGFHKPRGGDYQGGPPASRGGYRGGGGGDRGGYQQLPPQHRGSTAAAMPYGAGPRDRENRFRDGRRKIDDYDFEESVLKKIGSCNIPVYFSFETISSEQLKDENQFQQALPPGVWMTPELPLRITKLTCTIRQLLRVIGAYLLAEDNGSNPERREVQKKVTEKMPEGTPISIILYKQKVNEKNPNSPIEGVSVDQLVTREPLAMKSVQSLAEAEAELQNDVDAPSHPYLRAVFDLKSARENCYNGNAVLIVCPAPPPPKRQTHQEEQQQQ